MRRGEKQQLGCSATKYRGLSAPVLCNLIIKEGFVLFLILPWPCLCVETAVFSWALCSFLFLIPQVTLCHLLRCRTLMTFWVILAFCSNTRLSFAVRFGSSKPLLVLAPWYEGEKASVFKSLFKTYKGCASSLIKEVSKEWNTLWISFSLHLETLYLNYLF